MMGVTHATSGVAVGLATAPLVGLVGWEAMPFAATVAGAALLPDLDHPSATATRFLGPITGAASWALRGLSRAVYRATATPGRDEADGEHRALTHTVLGAVIAGAGWGAVAWWGGPWAAAAVVAAAALLASAAVGRWVLLALLPAVGVALLSGVDVPLAGAGLWVGIAVAIGCVTHSCGDALTRSGAPLLWPIRIRGTRWHRIAPPVGKRLLTNSPVERFVVLPAFVLASFVIAFVHFS